MRFSSGILKTLASSVPGIKGTRSAFFFGKRGIDKFP
jgi:hypothetical protein